MGERSGPDASAARHGSPRPRRRSRHAATAPAGTGGTAVVPAESATIDLHTHTLRSDGLLEPARLVADAAAAGVRLLAITDHDTLAGYRDVVATPGTIPAGLELVAGVEINALAGGDRLFADGEIHILGLGVDPDHEALEETLAGQRVARRVRFERMVERFGDLGLDVRGALEAAASGRTGPGAGDGLGVTTHDDALGRPTVARALVAIGAADSVEDAFERWLSRGRPGYVARDGIGPREAIAAIRAAGGLAVLAHYWDAADRPAVIEGLVSAGLGGIEVHHLSFTAETVAAVGAVAERFRLVPTGGTDYHGDLGSYAEAHARLAIPAGVGERVHTALARG